MLKKEKYCEIRDKVCIYNFHSILQMRCPYCNKFDHNFSYCPLITVRINKDLFYEKLKSERFQNRKKFKRKNGKEKKQNSILLIKKLNEFYKSTIKNKNFKFLYMNGKKKKKL